MTSGCCWRLRPTCRPGMSFPFGWYDMNCTRVWRWFEYGRSHIHMSEFPVVRKHVEVTSRIKRRRFLITCYMEFSNNWIWALWIVDIMCENREDTRPKCFDCNPSMCFNRVLEVSCESLCLLFVLEFPDIHTKVELRKETKQRGLPHESIAAGSTNNNVADGVAGDIMYYCAWNIDVMKNYLFCLNLKTQTKIYVKKIKSNR